MSTATIERGTQLDGALTPSVDILELVRPFQNANGLLEVPSDQQEDVYDQVRHFMDEAIHDTATSSNLFSEFVEGIEHGSSHSLITARADNLRKHFLRDELRNVAQVIRSRWEETPFRHTVKNLDQFDYANILEHGAYHYVLERDLFGPLIVNFAKDIKTLFKKKFTEQPDFLVVGMRRDFEPFGRAMRQLGVPETPAYFRRSIFMNTDPFDSTDRFVGAEEQHITRLAALLKESRVTTAPDALFLDSGCWGTLIAEFAGLRSFLSWLSTNQLAEELLSLPPEERFDRVVAIAPESFVRALDAVIDPVEQGQPLDEPERRRKLWKKVLTDNEVLTNLQGQELKTTAIDFYSHQGRDPRYPRHEKSVMSWIDTVAGDAIPDWFGEIVNDAIEENLASKAWAGPTELREEPDGKTGVVLLRNMDPMKEVAAIAARKGVEDAVEIYQLRDTLGMPVTPAETLQHMIALRQKTLDTGKWTGVPPWNTPTWNPGTEFLGADGAWERMTCFPESTYYNVDPSIFVI